MAKSTAEALALDPAARRLIAEDSLASDPQIAARALYEDLQTDLRPDLGSVRTKTLVLYAFDPTLVFPGGGKPTADAADAITAGAYRAMPDKQLVRIDGSRHFIMFDQPERLDALVKRFLRGS